MKNNRLRFEFPRDLTPFKSVYIDSLLSHQNFKIKDLDDYEA